MLQELLRSTENSEEPVFPISLSACPAELSEIIMEINNLRELAHDPDRPKQDCWRF